MVLVSKKRHLLKTFTWRIIASIDTLLIAWCISRDLTIGTSIALIEILTKMILYYFHERIWYQSKFGLKNENN